MHESLQVTTQLPDYSVELVAFARALDSAEMAVRTGLWHFSDLEDYSPEILSDSGYVPGWARQNLRGFEEHLPTLRSTFRAMVAAESHGIHIAGNRLGDASPPDFVQAAFQPVMHNYISHQPMTTAVVNSLPTEIIERAGQHRVVYWDSEVFVIPDSFPNSFVEVWFRRAYGFFDDGGAYPLRLELRDYGWEAFGIEP